MSTIEEREPRSTDLDGDDDWTMIHWYPKPPGSYIGAKARCGHVRSDPRSLTAIPPERRVECVVCIELGRSAGQRV